MAFQSLFAQVPLKPGTPTGTAALCQGSPNTVYNSTGSANATSYLWTISPATAGTIATATTTGTVTWSGTFTGTASIVIRAINASGTTASDTLFVVVAAVPAKPATPTGTTTLCQGTASTIFTTTGGTSATSYIWGISPATAGTIAGVSTTGTVTWSTFFSGTAKVFVKGSNVCSTSIPSDTLYVTVNPKPGKPGTPVGASPQCPTNSTVVVTSGSTNATNYQWSVIPSTAGTIAATTANATIAWSQTFSGIAKIIVNGNNGCGLGPVSDTLQITVNPLPVKPGTPTGITALCPNPPIITYTTTGATFATSYAWHILPATAGTIVGNTVNANVTWSATYTGIAKIFVNGVNTCGTGLASDTLYVTIMPLPGKPGTPTGTSPICQGSTPTTYNTIGGTNATSYLWYLLPATAGNIAGTTTTGTVTWNANYSGTARVFVRGVDSCGSGLLASDTLFVVVNPRPGKPGTPVGLSPICQGTLTSIINCSASTNANSYNWSIIPSTAGTLTGTTTSLTITWSPTFSGIVKVITVGVNTCGLGPVSDTLLITVNPLPVKPSTPVGPTPLCQGTASSVYTTTHGANTNTFTWYLLPATAGTIAGTDTTGTVTWSGTFSGTAKIIVKGNNTTCGLGPASDTLVVTITSLPPKPATPTGPSPICQGSAPTNYTTTGAVGATSYIWYLLPATAGTIAGTGTTGTVTWNANFSGIAKVNVRGVNACGNGLLVSDTLFITVNPRPGKPGTPVGVSPICQGTLTSGINCAAGTNSNSYLWNLLPATAGTIAGTTTSSTITWSSSFSGVAKIIAYGVNTCGQGTVSDTLLITVNPLPGKPATPTGPISVCKGSANTNYSTTGATAATSYQWGIFPAGAGTIAGTGTTGTVTWTPTYVGVVKIFVRGINACGQGLLSDSLTITVHNLPTPSLGNDTIICSGLPLTVTPGAFNAYSWQDGSALSTYTVAATDTIWVTVTDANNCTATDTTHITFITQTAEAGPDTTICPGSLLVLHASGGTNYLWSTGAPTAQANVSPTTTTTYYVTVSSNGVGCTAMDSVKVTTLPQISVSVTPTYTEICQGGTVALTASGGNNYLWNGGSTSAAISINPMGNSNISVVGYDGCGSDTAYAVVLVHPLPSSDFIIHPEIGRVGEPEFCYGITKDSINYFWYTDSGLSGAGNPTNFTFSDPGNHEITLVAMNQWGCIDSTTKTVYVRDNDATFWVPNAFTPDSDGKNDIFRPICNNPDLEYYELRIFDKWGEQVFLTYDITQGWDGTFKGEIGTPSSYVWIIYYKTPGLFVKHKIAGKVTLVR